MELKDWLNSINLNKKNLLEEDPDAKYPAYVVNRCLSGTIDSVMYANEMNRFPNLDKDMQYSFMLNGIRKRKRFAPWLKQDKINDLDLVKKYYGYNNEKARQALRILTPDQLKYIRKKMDVGGIK
tara:strand:+ start:3326 stop:3700 length:375 start_codon:yes stop_codon:yes gene_type:complete